MDAPRQNKFAMYQATNVVLTKKDYKSLWQGIVGFVQLQADLNTEIGTITSLSAKQGRRKTGLAEDKDAARLAMCKAGNIIAGAVAAYAHKVGNHELLTRVETTLSILLGGRGKDSRDKCADILSAATANLAALADYDVKQPDLDNLNQRIGEFDALSPQPQVALGEAKGAGQAMDATFDRADGILNNGLDNLMLKFEDTNPDFFRDYTNARIIIDRPGGHGNGNPPPTPPAPAK
jgi:hypothetical protein